MPEHPVARIIVDGYNVIGTAHGDMEKARGALLDLLRRYKEVMRHEVTVVFDGYHQGSGTETVSVTGGVKVMYSRLRDRADDVIKRIVAAEGAEWIVVTSDREVAGHAWSRGSVPVASEAFLGIVRRRIGDSALGSPQGIIPNGADEEDMEPEEPAIRKGNPHRPSKRQRALARALKKL